MSELLRRKLYDRLRTQLGTAYAVVGKLDVERDAGAVLALKTEVAAADSPTATANIRAAMSANGALSSSGELDIERQRWRSIRGRNLAHTTPVSLTTELFATRKLGWPPTAIDDRTRARTSPPRMFGPRSPPVPRRRTCSRHRREASASAR